MSAVIVIGAGIAGLAAARTLAEAGNPVTLIEARDRVEDASTPSRRSMAACPSSWVRSSSTVCLPS